MPPLKRWPPATESQQPQDLRRFQTQAQSAHKPIHPARIKNYQRSEDRGYTYHKLSELNNRLSEPILSIGNHPLALI